MVAEEEAEELKGERLNLHVKEEKQEKERGREKVDEGRQRSWREEV